MILDFLTECTNIIKCSYYDSINADVLNPNYGIKKGNNLLSWKLSNPAVSSVKFTIFSNEVKTLKDIQIELAGFSQSSNVNIMIETSLDYINWYEPVYKQDVTTYKYTNPIYFRTTSPSGTGYVCISDVTQRFYLESDPDYITNLAYAFTKYDSNTKETTYLYNNYEFKFIRVTLSNIAFNSEYENVKFKTFNILIDEPFSDNALNKNLLEIKSTMFNQQKIFEEQELIPDLFKNYFKMIDEKNLEVSTLLYSNSKINVNGFATSTSLEGIGNDIIDIDTVVY